MHLLQASRYILTSDYRIARHCRRRWRQGRTIGMSCVGRGREQVPWAQPATAAPALRSTDTLLQAAILPALLRLTLPNLAAMLVVTLVSTCETIYVGVLGTKPLAAIA